MDVSVCVELRRGRPPVDMRTRFTGQVSVLESETRGSKGRVVASDKKLNGTSPPARRRPGSGGTPTGTTSKFSVI